MSVEFRQEQPAKPCEEPNRPASDFDPIWGGISWLRLRQQWGRKQESSIFRKFRNPVVKQSQEKKRFVLVYNQDAPRNPSAQTYFELDLGRISILVFDICGLG